MRKEMIIIVCLSGFAQLMAQPQAPAKLKVLIVEGFSNHDWKQTTLLTKQILEQTGRCRVNVSTTPATSHDSAWKKWRPVFFDYDVVIQNTNNIGDSTLQWPAEMEEQLLDYVKNGGGLYILHSANNAFPHWKGYDTLIGLGWRKAGAGLALPLSDEGEMMPLQPGQGKDTYHGRRADLVLHKVNDHPINHDFPAQWKAADLELYQYARGPAVNLSVLSYARDPASRLNWPVEWVVTYGKGRVYNSSMGHLWKGDIYPLGYRCMAFQTSLIRAIEWLATGKVTYALPVDFPTRDQVSIKDSTALHP